jgi:excisionase family DNA binding protein
MDVFVMNRLDDLFADYPAHLSVSQMAEVLGISRPTAYKWLNEGTVPGYRVGGAWVILRDEVKDLIAAGRNLAEDIAEDVEDFVEDIADKLSEEEEEAVGGEEGEQG